MEQTFLQKETVKILITGDICPINRVETLALEQNYQLVFNDFIDVMKGNDLNIADLECPLTSSNITRPKTGPYQKASPEAINILTYADVSVAALANNHIMDYNTQGAKDTLDLCNANGIATLGLGSDKYHASMPFTTTIKGKRIAVLNYSDNEFITANDSEYCCNVLDPVQCFNDLKSTKAANDFVIVLIHAGNEFYELPSPRTKKLYRFLADCGADVVLSNHTHVFSGYEVYNETPIFYGMGNFIYDWPGKMNSNWNKGYVVKLMIADKLEFEIIPLKQGNEKPGVFRLSSTEKDAFDIEIDRLSGIIGNDQELESCFHNYCKSVAPMYDAFIEPYFGKYVTALQKRGYLPKLLTRKKRLLHLNLIRCESHREVTTWMLKKYE